MTLGPLEYLVVGFTGTRFDGSIAREIEKVREHPAVKQVMQHFPGARIAAVRPVDKPAPQPENADEPEAFKEDGTN